METMIGEQLLKSAFVELDLARTLREATQGYVDRCKYIVDGPEEYVVVMFNRGAIGPFTLAVNVTSDSRWAILKDVMKAVAKKYE